MSDQIKFWTTRGPYGWMSNFSKHPCEYFGDIYPTSEHLYQSFKLDFVEQREKVRLAKTPKEAKQIAHSFPLPEWWDGYKYEYMLITLRIKLTTNPQLLDFLLNTGDKTLIEDSPHDYIWGIGKDGTGQNLLGKAWMETRDRLKEIQTQPNTFEGI
jgi:ribA/ribD-fused uncharacterized protein